MLLHQRLSSNVGRHLCLVQSRLPSRLLCPTVPTPSPRFLVRFLQDSDGPRYPSHPYRPFLYPCTLVCDPNVSSSTSLTFVVPPVTDLPGSRVVKVFSILVVWSSVSVPLFDLLTTVTGVPVKVGPILDD